MAKRTEERVTHAVGARKFAAFLTVHGISLAAAARSLHVSAPTILAWRDGEKVPTSLNQERIAVWTNGAVRPAHWGALRDAVRVRPYVRLVG